MRTGFDDPDEADDGVLLPDLDEHDDGLDDDDDDEDEEDDD